MKNLRRRIGALAVAAALIPSAGIGYAYDGNGEDEYSAEYELYSDDVTTLSAEEENPDRTLLFEFDGESEDQIDRLKLSNTDVTITHDYANSGSGAFLVAVTKSYGSVQFPFDFEKGALYEISYAATAPADAGEVWMNSNIYARPSGIIQAGRRLENGTFVKQSRQIYYPDKDLTDTTFGFFCNDAGKRFVLDDVKMYRYDDFGVSKKSAFYDGIENVEPYAEIYLTLNYEIKRGSIGSFVIESENGKTYGISSYEMMPDNKTLILSHDFLDNGTNYTLKLDSVTDTVGRELKNLEVGFSTIKDVVVTGMGFTSEKLAAGEMSLTGQIENHSMEEKNAVVKIWLYRGLFMTQRISVPVTIPMLSTVSLSDKTIDIPDISDGKYLLVASVWEDDFDNRPICVSIRNSN